MSKLEDMLRRHEGEKLRPYKCTAGKLTIGVGRNLEAKGISKECSEMMLQEDIAECLEDLRTFDWWPGLNQARKDALTDMRFNLGGEGLRKFKNTLAHVAVGRYEEAADGMLASKWAGQVGQRAKTLAAMMRTGKYVD